MDWETNRNFVNSSLLLSLRDWEFNLLATIPRGKTHCQTNVKRNGRFFARTLYCSEYPENCWACCVFDCMSRGIFIDIFLTFVVFLYIEMICSRNRNFYISNLNPWRKSKIDPNNTNCCSCFCWHFLDIYYGIVRDEVIRRMRRSIGFCGFLNVRLGYCK